MFEKSKKNIVLGENFQLKKFCTEKLTEGRTVKYNTNIRNAYLKRREIWLSGSCGTVEKLLYASCGHSCQLVSGTCRAVLQSYSSIIGKSKPESNWKFCKINV